MTRAEEIAVEEYPNPNIPREYVGTEAAMIGQGLVYTARAAFVKGYKRGQRDRWIPLSEKCPEEKETVWACNPVTRFVALACRVWIEDVDQSGWLWSVSNGTIYSENGHIVSECEMQDDYDFTHWQPLPILPPPPYPEQR